MSNFIAIDSDNIWPEDIEISLSDGFSAINDERGPSIRYWRNNEVYTIANLPGELFAALYENPAWARAIGTALDRTYNRGRDSGMSEGEQGVQSAIKSALGLL